MWVFLIDGFYSVVADRENRHQLLVRCRDKDDADRMAERLGVTVVDTTGPEFDYAYRMHVDRNVFADVLADEARNIPYDNFKNEVADKRGYTRANVYGRVWSLLRAAFGQAAS
jgi:hypothetical protein